MEARPPAENRHGGAPRGERPASWDAPRLTSADGRASHARQQHKCACRRSAAVSLKPMTSQYNLCQLAAIPGSFPVRWPGHAGSSLFAHCGRQRGWASTARGTDVCPVGGLTGFRQALPPPIHRMIWIELPAIEANIGSEPVELNESLRAVVAVLAEAHERAEPEFVGVAAMWLDVITNLCGRESR